MEVRNALSVVSLYARAFSIAGARGVGWWGKSAPSVEVIEQLDGLYRPFRPRMASRTFRVRDAGVIGFWRYATPDSKTPCWRIASSV